MKKEQKKIIDQLMLIVKKEFESCKNFEDKNELINKYYNEYVKIEDDYLCFEFAKEYSRFLTKKQIDKIGDIILEKKNPYLCIMFPKYFNTENLESFAKVIKESPMFYVMTFLDAFPNFDANYFADKVAKDGSAEQNLKYVIENNVSILLPHSIKIAQEGDAEQNLNFIISVDTLFENYYYSDIRANVFNIIKSGNAAVNLNFVLMLKPKRNLEKHAKIIADSDDLLLNYIACENWPDQDPLELAMFTKVIHNHTIQELENRLIFKLRMLDKDSRRKTISKYFDIETEKSNQEIENETEKE